MQISDFPHIIASLNGLSVLFLTVAFIYIRAGNREMHRKAMICALAISAFFLVFYVVYKANSGFAKFGGEGAIRPIYFTILITHVLGAILITFMVPITVWRALKGNFEKHKKIARFTWPLWMWVGISGVVVYAMTVHLFPYQGG
ncbi:MAG: DUF420 domain-containing protein [Rhodospirillales bacterium]|jgi:putative membrane protein|nr:DUF420 domain-containing protein [Rhodospirillales bacterium]